MSENLSDYLTTAQAAECLKVTPGRIRQFIMRGQLTSTKIGFFNLILKKDLEAFKKQVRPPGNPAWQEKKKPKNRKKT